MQLFVFKALSKEQKQNTVKTQVAMGIDFLFTFSDELSHPMQITQGINIFLDFIFGF